MIQGTGSDVGKSVIVAGLCRIARRRGVRVAPFKPQNMSNNAAACADGGEIGRAQAVQARAAGLAPHTDFNPGAAETRTPTGAHRSWSTAGRSAPWTPRTIRPGRQRLMGAVMDSFGRLVAAHELVIVEGAGSPAEVNLRAGDIANMGFARRVNATVCLVGDIDRGGVIAALVGTQAVLDPQDSALIVGFAVNKFRGDPSLFEAGIAVIEQRTGWPCFGLIPWAAARLASAGPKTPCRCPSSTRRSPDGFGLPPRCCPASPTLTTPTRYAWSRRSISALCRPDDRFRATWTS